MKEIPVMDDEYDQIDALYQRICEELSQEAEAAFADVEYPGDDNLVNKPVHWSCEDLVEDFRGKHWKEITPQLAARYYIELTCLTPAAFRFYFPALLIASLCSSDAAGLSEFLFYNLIPLQEEDTDMNWMLGRRKSFTAQQRAVIRAFVKFVLETNPYHVERFGERAKSFWEESQ